MVQPVAAANAEYPFPGSYVHRRIARQREITVFYRAAKHCLSAVHIEPFSFYLEVAHTELHLLRIRLFTVAQRGCQFIECRAEFIPCQEILSHRKFHFNRIVSRTDTETLLYGSDFVPDVRVETLSGKRDFSFGGRGGLHIHTYQCFLIAQIGIYLNVLKVYFRSGLQFDSSDDTIPVALRLVGDTVGVGAYVDFLDAVVDADSNQTRLSGGDRRSQVIDVGNTKTVLHTEFLLVYPNGGFDMRTFQEKGDSFPFPVGRDCNFLLIPGYAYIMFVGSQEKGEFYLSLYPVFFHIWVEVVRTVVEASRPLGAGGHFIPL